MYLKFILEVIIDNLNNFLGKIFTPCCCTGDHEYNSAFNFFCLTFLAPLLVLMIKAKISKQIHLI